MLASYHEALAQTAPSEPSCPSLLLRCLQCPSSRRPASTPRPTGEASTSKDNEKEKKEPVTARDHLDVAADLMSDIQVETYSSMDKREKTEL
jgi:26S proteasome regulatory subunit N5